MGTFEDRKANTLINLNNVEFLSGQYQNRVSTLASLVDQKKTLQGRIQAAKAKKQDILQSAETYEKEFIDRSTLQQKYTTGFLTFQDGILFAFFAAYLALCGIALHTLLKNGNPLFLIFGVFVFLVTGILIAELIRRFA
jgi:hypothetical protein